MLLPLPLPLEPDPDPESSPPPFAHARTGDAVLPMMPMADAASPRAAIRSMSRREGVSGPEASSMLSTLRSALIAVAVHRTSYAGPVWPICAKAERPGAVMANR